VKNQDHYPFILFVAKTDGHSTTLMDTAQHWTISVISKMLAESSRLVGITLCTDDIFYCMRYVTVGVWPL